jgi:hypothetical protein
MARIDFLSKQRKQITTRLDELRPLYEEYLTLEKAHEALEQVGEPVRRAVRRGPGRPPGSRTRTGAKKRGPGRPPAKRRPGRPPAARKRAATTRPRRRRSSGSTRADQTLAAIKSTPGITIPELAGKLGIRPNYLYRVTAQLQKERKVRRRNDGFHAA